MFLLFHLSVSIHSPPPPTAARWTLRAPDRSLQHVRIAQELELFEVLDADPGRNE